MDHDPRPATYADWVALLERFRGGDDDVLEAMERGTLTWSSVVAQRWTRQLSEALSARLQALSRRLQTALDRAAGRPALVTQALLDARRALAPLRRVARLACQPENVRAHLEAELDRWARQTQESLERAAQPLRHDGGVLLKTLRDTPLPAAAPPSTPPRAEESRAVPLGDRRRILF